MNLAVSAGNGSAQAGLEIYADASDLKYAAVALTGFPKRKEDEFLWELGSEDPKKRFAFYFRLRVFQYAAHGHCAIEFRFNNNQKPPERQISEFYLKVCPTDIDQLGKMFASFAELEDTSMEWSVPCN